MWNLVSTKRSCIAKKSGISERNRVIVYESNINEILLRLRHLSTFSLHAGYCFCLISLIMNMVIKMISIKNNTCTLSPVLKTKMNFMIMYVTRSTWLVCEFWVIAFWNDSSESYSVEYKKRCWKWYWLF